MATESFTKKYDTEYDSGYLFCKPNEQLYYTFDTSALPQTAIITEVRLKLECVQANYAQIDVKHDAFFTLRDGNQTPMTVETVQPIIQNGKNVEVVMSVRNVNVTIQNCADYLASIGVVDPQIGQLWETMLLIAGNIKFRFRITMIVTYETEPLPTPAIFYYVHYDQNYPGNFAAKNCQVFYAYRAVEKNPQYKSEIAWTPCRAKYYKNGEWLEVMAL